MTDNIAPARKAVDLLYALTNKSIGATEWRDVVHRLADHATYLQKQVETLTRKRDEALVGQHAAECKRIYEQHSEINDLRATISRYNSALKGFDADYMTSEKHHPDYVLIPVAVFGRVRALIGHT